MLLEYIQAALRHAKYEILPDDGSYYGEIRECNGVYANAETLGRMSGRTPRSAGRMGPFSGSQEPPIADD